MIERLSIRNTKKITSFLKSIKGASAKPVLQAVATYLIGNMSHGLKHYQSYKYVSLAKAYGKWSTLSDALKRQRLWAIIAIKEGRIAPGVPHRTGNAQRGYYMQETNKRGTYAIGIGNKTKDYYYTRDNQAQARLNALAGWKKEAVVIRDNLAGAFRAGRAAMNKWLKENKSK